MFMINDTLRLFSRQCGGWVPPRSAVPPEPSGQATRCGTHTPRARLRPRAAAAGEGSGQARRQLRRRRGSPLVLARVVLAGGSRTAFVLREPPLAPLLEPGTLC